MSPKKQILYKLYTSCIDLKEENHMKYTFDGMDLLFISLFFFKKRLSEIKDFVNLKKKILIILI